MIERVVAWENLVEANRLAGMDRSDCVEVVMFESDLWGNLGRLQMELLWGTYRPAPWAINHRDQVAFYATWNIQKSNTKEINMPRRLLQAAVAFDQLINCLVSLLIGGGWADETISARMWRNRAMPWWRESRWLVDKLFWWQPNHCYQSFVSELQRKQLPEDYQGLT